MSFNENTNNLIIINYRPGAGGKFLSNCLALSEKVLHLEEKFAKTKFKKNWKEYQSFKASTSSLRLSKKYQIHIEFEHGQDIYGFNYEDNHNAQVSKCNNFFKELSYQNNYFFFLTDHFSQNFIHFKNSKNIIMINDRDILKNRSYKIHDDIDLEKILPNLKNYFLFDISSVYDNNLFIKEIEKVCSWLEIEIKNKNYLSELREYFIKNLKIKMSSSKVSDHWDQQGFYRGSFNNKV
jgi:hypothetical protein